MRGDLQKGTELQELLKLTNLYGLKFVQSRLPEGHLQALGQFTNLTSLDLYHNYASEQLHDYLYLSTLTNLRSLSTTEIDLDEFCMAHLTDLTQLEQLPFNLDGDSIISAAAHFKNQTAIFIHGEIVTDAGVRNLPCLTKLKHLSLKKCTSITDSAVKDFSTLTNLRSIAISSCSALTTDALTGFSKCTSLREFHLETSPYINSLSPLIHCVNLRCLTLNKCYVESYGLSALQHFTNLTHLNCSAFVQLKDSGMKYFNLPSLRILNLHGDANITDEGLKFLSDLTDLQHLELGICERITDAGLQYLSRLVGLTYLGMLSLVRITDQGVKYLTGLTRLKHLDLSSCRVTDAAVRLFANRRGEQQLHRLDIYSCPSITNEGIALRDMITSFDYYFADGF